MKKSSQSRKMSKASEASEAVEVGSELSEGTEKQGEKSKQCQKCGVAESSTVSMNTCMFCPIVLCSQQHGGKCSVNHGCWQNTPHLVSDHFYFCCYLDCKNPNSQMCGLHVFTDSKGYPYCNKWCLLSHRKEIDGESPEPHTTHTTHATHTTHTTHSKRSKHSLKPTKSITKKKPKSKKRINEDGETEYKCFRCGDYNDEDTGLGCSNVDCKRHMCNDCIYPNGQYDGAVCSRRCHLKWLDQNYQEDLQIRKRCSQQIEIN